MALDDFDTSHRRECMSCHRSGFDDGDWQFVGYDDLAELYICPECVETTRDYSDDLLDPPARTPDTADSGQTCPRCAGKGDYKVGIYHETCDVCAGSGHV